MIAGSANAANVLFVALRFFLGHPSRPP